MIIQFSALGAGDSRQTDLCGDCKYTLMIQRHDYPATMSWLTGSQIMEQYGSQDVKITVRGIKPCIRHAARGGADGKRGPRFLEAALKSGIDISDNVDEYRKNILKQRYPGRTQ